MSISPRELNEILRRLERLDRAIAERPLRGGGGGTTAAKTLTIIGGNTLADGVTLGIKYAASAPATVPTLYNPSVDTSFIDGIGRATLTTNGVTSTVLVANYFGNGSPIGVAMIAGQIVSAGPTLTIPLVSDATQSVTLYVPYSP